MEAVIQVDAGSLNECRIFADVAVADPVHIGICADLDASAQRLAASAYQILLVRFGQLAAAGAAPMPQLCQPARLLNCRARSQPASFSLLVLVLGPGLATSNLANLATSWLSRPGSAVLAVLPIGGRPSLSLPPSLRRINAVNASIGVDAVVDAIEVAASLRERKLFISYRRDDAHAISEELFDAFGHAGWRVYLDRFSGTPGQYFPREIVDELAEKGAVLVVESPNLRQSTWTLLEVAVARRLSLGLFALQLPNSPSLAGIRRRRLLSTSEIIGGTNPRLSAGVATDVVRFVGQIYLEQSHFRRAVMASRLRLALAGEGLTATPTARGCWEVTGTKYVVHLAARPPGLNEVRRAIEAAEAISPSSVPVVVGPHRLQPPRQAGDVAWLTARSGGKLRGEWKMTNLAHDMKQGQL